MTSFQPNAFQSNAFQIGAGVTDTLIGRKYPRRRRRYSQRFEALVEKIDEVDLEVVAKEYAEKVIQQAREIASARTDLEIAKRMMFKSQEKIDRLSILEARVVEAEERMIQLKDEEDFIMLLAFAV